MSVPTGPDQQRGNYDRWTFARWAAPRELRRRARLRAQGLAACAAVAVLCVLGWAYKHHAERSPAVAPRTVPGAPGVLAGVVVILDPGHGGEDPGATLRWGRQTVQEAALTYRTALEVSHVLRGQGAQVRFTVRSRMLGDGWELAQPTPSIPLDAALVTTDRPLRVRHSPRQLWQRADLARQVWASAARTDPHAARDVFFLSLHFDEFHDAAVHGGLICVDRRAGPPPSFGVALARGMTAHGWARPDALDGETGLASDGLGVLNPRYNPVPQRALLEVATLSNFDDYLRASDPVWRGQVAEEIARAITEVHQAPAPGN